MGKRQAVWFQLLITKQKLFWLVGWITNSLCDMLRCRLLKTPCFHLLFVAYPCPCTSVSWRHHTAVCVRVSQPICDDEWQFWSSASSLHLSLTQTPSSRRNLKVVNIASLLALLFQLMHEWNAITDISLTFQGADVGYHLLLHRRGFLDCSGLWLLRILRWLLCFGRRCCSSLCHLSLHGFLQSRQGRLSFAQSSLRFKTSVNFFLKMYFQENYGGWEMRANKAPTTYFRATRNSDPTAGEHQKTMTMLVPSTRLLLQLSAGICPKNVRRSTK